MSDTARLTPAELDEETAYLSQRDAERLRFLARVNGRRLRNPKRGILHRQARRAANAADPRRQRQVPKRDRPLCGSLAAGPNRPCRAHVMPYRDETGAPRLRPLCFKHWNEAQAQEAEQRTLLALHRAEREAQIARGECICDAATNCGYHLPSCPKWWSP